MKALSEFKEKHKIAGVGVILKALLADKFLLFFAVGFSAVCDCGISWSYSLTF